MTHHLLQFSYLQLLDFLTTIAFLLHGVQEGNPFVRYAFGLSSNPIYGLVLVKGGGMMLGLYCWRMGRERLLSRINLMFAVLVAWNLVALIFGSVRRA